MTLANLPALALGYDATTDAVFSCRKRDWRIRVDGVVMGRWRTRAEALGHLHLHQRRASAVHGRHAYRCIDAYDGRWAEGTCHLLPEFEPRFLATLVPLAGCWAAYRPSDVDHDHAWVHPSAVPICTGDSFAAVMVRLTAALDAWAAPFGAPLGEEVGPMVRRATYFDAFDAVAA